ncbi:hypothetical protein ACP70R_004513 [Stipagrostis hirtigluma subsp. patula]
MAAGAADAGLRGLPDGTDRLSALPDELLQAVLARLPSTAAAARTSVLSHRWRRAWAGVPALSFHVDQQRPLGPLSSTADAVDAALAAYSAEATPARLAVHVDDLRSKLLGGRIAPWLRFASLRLAGELFLSASDYFVKPPPIWQHERQRQWLELPACERATRIELARINVRLSLPRAGAFAALRALRISDATTVDGDIGRLVSVQCPRLRELEMSDVGIADTGDLSIRSASLVRLVLRRVSIRKNGQLVVAAPRLHHLALVNCGDRSAAATIAAPMLAEVFWNHTYNPSRHSFEEVDRQIYRLELVYGSNSSLLGRFDVVDELCLYLSKPSGANGYKKIIEDIGELPKTNLLEVKGLSMKQHLGPIMLHLLGKCSKLTKLKIDLFPKKKSLCTCGCSCAPLENRTTDIFAVDWLDEVEISYFTGTEDDIELLKLPFWCKMKPRRMAIHEAKDTPLSYEAQKNIWALARPYCTMVEFKNTQFHR